MTKKLILAGVLLLLFLTYFTVNQKLILSKISSLDIKLIKKQDTAYQGPLHQVDISEEKLFFNAVQKNKEVDKINYLIKGGVIPHHLLASELTAQLISKISSQKVDTVILIGPNHQETGNNPILTSKYGWHTPFGIIDPNISIIDNLISHNLVSAGEDVLGNEYSITNILPFIKYYFPNTKIVPLSFSSKTPPADVDKLSDVLKIIVNTENIILASIDFSHYLPNTKAQVKDQETLESIKEWSYNKITNFRSDNLDSPESLYLLLKVMQKIDAFSFKILANTNSGVLLKDDTIPVTSYITILYH